MDEYDGKQFVGIDLHRQRSVIVRQSESGEQLSAVRIINDPVALGLEIERAGPNPEVVLEATYGWYWAVDTLQAAGAHVHLAHPLGVKGFRYRRVKNDVRDAADLADLLRMNRLPEAWIAPPATRELRELVRYRAKIVALRSGLKAQVHAVLAKAGVVIAVSDLFGVGGRQRLAKVPLGAAYVQRVISLLEPSKPSSAIPPRRRSRSTAPGWSHAAARTSPRSPWHANCSPWSTTGCATGTSAPWPPAERREHPGRNTRAAAALSDPLPGVVAHLIDPACCSPHRSMPTPAGRRDDRQPDQSGPAPTYLRITLGEGPTPTQSRR